jgi:hypothetical protein
MSLTRAVLPLRLPPIESRSTSPWARLAELGGPVDGGSATWSPVGGMVVVADGVVPVGGGARRSVVDGGEGTVVGVALVGVVTVGLGPGVVTSTPPAQSSGAAGSRSPVWGLRNSHAAVVVVVDGRLVVVVDAPGSGSDWAPPPRVLVVVDAFVVTVVDGYEVGGAVVVDDGTVAGPKPSSAVVVVGAAVVVVEAGAGLATSATTATASCSASASATGEGASATAPQTMPDVPTTIHAALLIRRARRTNSLKPSTLRPERPGTAGNVTGGLLDPPWGSRIR